MTTPVTPYRASHTLTGSIVPLPYDWKIDAATELLVTLVNTSVTPNVETTLVNGTDYSVSGVGNGSGGNVTPTTAYTAGWKIVITNNVTYNQAVDFTNQNSVKPEVVEQMGDSLSKQIKQIVETLTRCVKTTVGSLTSPESIISDLLNYVRISQTAASTSTTQAGIATTKATEAQGWATAAQSAAAGINLTNARVASTANINISTPGATIDGVTLSIGDRVLLKNQTTASQNGIYIWAGASSPMSRASDMDTWAEVISKVTIIEEGSSNADTAFLSVSDRGGTLGTTAINFVKFSTPDLTQTANTWLYNQTIQGALFVQGGAIFQSGVSFVQPVVLSGAAKLTMLQSTTSLSALNIPHGVTPTSPADGDIWSTTDGIYARVNGKTNHIAMTDWESYTPTLTHYSGAITNASATALWRRVGNTLEVSASVVLSGTGGTFGGLYFSLPSGLTVDTAKLSNTASILHLGDAIINDSSPAAYYEGIAYYKSTTTVGLLISVASTTYTTYTAPSGTLPITLAAGDVINIKFSVPISGW